MIVNTEFCNIVNFFFTFLINIPGLGLHTSVTGIPLNYR